MTGSRTALITGVAGQDGSYLADLLLSKGYRVVGTHRPGSIDRARIAGIADRIELREADLLDARGLARLLETVQPQEIYNLAGHSFVPSSWTAADLARDVTALGAGRLLDAIREVDPAIRFYQASTSEIFGDAPSAPQDEQTPPNPRNPYGQAKAFAHGVTVEARDRHGLFAVSGILFNHESPRRGLEFLTRKVSDGAARIALGRLDRLTLGDLEARRDWGFAGDYVRAMWLMLQQDTPSDYVVASGVLHSVRDVCEIAFGRVGLDYREHVEVDAGLLRSPERVPLLGNPSKARRELGWSPEVPFEALIQSMVDADLERQRGVSERMPPSPGSTHP